MTRDLENTITRHHHFPPPDAQKQKKLREEANSKGVGVEREGRKEGVHYFVSYACSPPYLNLRRKKKRRVASCWCHQSANINHSQHHWYTHERDITGMFRQYTVQGEARKKVGKRHFFSCTFFEKQGNSVFRQDVLLHEFKRKRQRIHATSSIREKNWKHQALRIQVQGIWREE